MKFLIHLHSAKRANKVTSHYSRGFTFLELVATVAVAAILITVAAPNFNNLLKNNRLGKAANDLVAALNLARQTAISTNQISMLCHTASGDESTPACGDADSNWHTGYIVYQPPTRTITNAGRDYTSGANADRLIRQADLSAADLIVTNVNADDYVVFLGNGTLQSPSTPPQITICDSRDGETGRQVTVSPVGRINTADVTCL
jgi:type IV fimbrial biogenesis protein FimT